MTSQSALVLFALATMAAAPDAQISSISYDRMPLGQQFVIETDNEVFRGQLLDRRTGECQMAIAKSGDRFSPSQTVYLLGATAGPQDRQTLVLMHRVNVGMKMELGLGDLRQKNRVITGEVRSIRFLR